MQRNKEWYQVFILHSIPWAGSIAISRPIANMRKATLSLHRVSPVSDPISAECNMKT